MRRAQSQARRSSAPPRRARRVGLRRPHDEALLDGPPLRAPMGDARRHPKQAPLARASEQRPRETGAVSALPSPARPRQALPGAARRSRERPKPALPKRAHRRPAPPRLAPRRPAPAPGRERAAGEPRAHAAAAKLRMAGEALVEVRENPKPAREELALPAVVLRPHASEGYERVLRARASPERGSTPGNWSTAVFVPDAQQNQQERCEPN